MFNSLRIILLFNNVLYHQKKKNYEYFSKSISTLTLKTYELEIVNKNFKCLL